MQTIDAAMLWTPAGWRSDAGFDCDGDGRIQALDRAEPTAGAGWIVPGIPNLHSHAFQRAMAGLAERRTLDGPAGAAPRDAHDSFWTWRETMYRMAARFDPDTLHAVAAQLYVEMLEAGYTSVCEFHYLHHAPDGKPYADPAAMSRALIAAAREAGIRLTLLPVLYMSGGFDGRALGERQRRFGHDVDAFLALLETLRSAEDASLRIGCALHSLRAVPADAMRALLAALPRALPRHIHIAEQVGEVQDCLALRGARPVEWLLANAEVDARWTLVHATHLDEAEVQGIARSGATVALCPTTEANLGDGLFPLRDYLDAGGAFGIGSDSQISVSPVEELRWLEYGQRLATRHRNIAVDGVSPSVGETLLRGVLASGGHASGQPVGRLEPGACADWLVLDTDAPQFAGVQAADAVDRWLFSGNRNLVREVHVGGRRVVAEGRHLAREAIAARYRETLRTLLAAA
ncbi:formimidoylglutamate deiminase [Cognatiluteimonas weifangensis]|uniref:Formimidoylglutamate deiminase n=1 Tax=Cognatiluteimonas weifangensis TaxID=2303539 RepID=A0A372DIL8_9GAMM|nr:formimidoylglutamate deiminase [Luteimonas weifangensis]RFP59415.1 formimidoylglutamate deiminase [Luteimonas weifangensis]